MTGTKTLFGLSSIASASALALMLAAPSAMALEVAGGDYEVYPTGVNIGVLYYQHAETGDVYSNGHKVASNFNVTSDIGLLRYIRPIAVTPTINWEPQFILPFGEVKGKDNAAALGSASGTADLILGSVFKWLLDPTTRDAFSIGPFLYLPTGNYDRNKALNLGENRWKLLVQFAYVTHFNPTWALDLITDVTVNGDNDDAGPTSATLKQDPSYESQAHLRYNLSQATMFAVDYGIKYGGNEKIDGVSQGDRQRTQYARLTAQTFITPTLQLQGQVGADLEHYNGAKEKGRLNLRLAKIF
jgi:hypothetical protein